MSDLISRADVEQTVEDNILCYTHSDRPIDQDPDTECHKAIRIAFRMLRKDLGKLPSVQPEVILCKDCKHHHYESEDIPYCDRIDYGYGWKDYDFCSFAERKQDANND